MKRQNSPYIILLLTFVAVFLTGFAANDLINRLTGLLHKYAGQIASEKIYIFTDKNVYKPGERIWFSVFLSTRSNNSGNSSNGTLALFDQYGAVKARRRVHFEGNTTDGSITIPGPLNEGVYLLAAYSGDTLTDSVNSDSYRQIIIKQRVIPGFVIQADLKKAVYQPGDEINMNFRFFNEFNEPVRNVHYRIDMFDGGNLVQSLSYHRGKKYLNHVSLRLSESISSGQIDLLVYARSNISTEHLRIMIPVKNQGIFISFFPEGGKLHAGISNRLAFRVRDWFGDPIQITGLLIDGNNLTVSRLQTNGYGTGTVDFIPFSEQEYFLQITAPRYLAGKRFSIPPVNDRGIALSLTGIEKQLAEFSIRPVGLKVPPVLYLTSKSADSLYWFRKILLNTPLKVKVPGKGLSDFAVFDERGHLLGQRLFFIDDRELFITLSTDREAYAPRSSTLLRIKTTNRKGQPVKAKLSLSVTDTIRLGYALNEPDITSYFELFSYLEKPYPDWTWETSEPGGSERQFLTIFTSRLEQFNWEDILTRQKHRSSTLPKIIREDQMYRLDNNESYYTYRNYTGNSYYLASNPGLLNPDKKTGRRTPYYKKLLENGTPLREVIMVMRPYNIINGGIVFYGMMNSIYFQDGALIILDKQKLGTRANLLDDISPYTIESIRISTQPIDIHEFTAFNSVGIIELKTKSGKEKPKGKNKRILDDLSQKDSVFLAPEYKNAKRFSRKRKDFRTTVYWAPMIETDETGTAKISYYNPDIRTTLVITAEGITPDGKTGTARRSYIVK